MNYGKTNKRKSCCCGPQRLASNGGAVLRLLQLQLRHVKRGKEQKIHKDPVAEEEAAGPEEEPLVRP
uniref:HDC02629 n=1 Tax=Drosophila melanogaster TaxID=7227 RepID=Q6IHG4_DROME|nr:TPA_inf: HDC02629 [Drosophila melanogaster]